MISVTTHVLWDHLISKIIGTRHKDHNPVTVDMITKTATGWLMGARMPWTKGWFTSWAGCRNFHHTTQSGMRLKTYTLFYFWNFLFNIFGTQLTAVTETSENTLWISEDSCIWIYILNLSIYLSVICLPLPSLFLSTCLTFRVLF